MSEEFVTYCPAIETAWDLKVMSPLADPLEGTMKTVENTLDAFEEILVPTKIEFVAFAASSLEELIDKGARGAEQTVSGVIEEERGISYRELRVHLLEEFNDSLSNRVVTRVEIRNCRIKVVLDGAEYEISANHALYRPDESDDAIKSISLDPLQMVFFMPVQTSGKARNQIVIRTNTDLWFENSDAGAVNRQRLGRAFDKLKSSLDVVDSEMASDKYPISFLQECGFTELIP